MVLGEQVILEGSALDSGGEGRDGTGLPGGGARGAAAFSDITNSNFVCLRQFSGEKTCILHGTGLY